MKNSPAEKVFRALLESSNASVEAVPAFGDPTTQSNLGLMGAAYVLNNIAELGTAQGYDSLQYESEVAEILLRSRNLAPNQRRKLEEIRAGAFNEAVAKKGIESVQGVVEPTMWGPEGLLMPILGPEDVLIQGGARLAGAGVRAIAKVPPTSHTPGWGAIAHGIREAEALITPEISKYLEEHPYVKFAGIAEDGKAIYVAKDKNFSTANINTLERDALRQNLLKTSYGSGASTKNKEITYIIGGSGSGKSHVADLYYLGGGDALLVDPDWFRERLPEAHKFVDYEKATHAESASLAQHLLVEAMAKGDNIVRPTIGGDYELLSKNIEMLKQQGYKVRIVFVDAVPENALKNLGK